ncbi:hypothetical protein PG993_006294 [Apiospora rasikravindrae]|uniref:Berberine/berberine-like domain-containing protein n=1 Tax=Apiospora rasikravindrae TaxID=990691 RepID=A0ABR1T5B0_9PEZI
MGMHNVPQTITSLNDERGGNVMGLNRALKGRNAIMMLLSINVAGEENREVCDVGLEAGREFLEGADAFARSEDRFVDWTYPKYADRAQNPLRTLLDPEEIKKTAVKYDPTGVFQTRPPGGFKISEV